MSITRGVRRVRREAIVGSATKDVRWRGQLTIAIVGAVVAGSAAWEGVANYGDTWREKRRAAELLKVEGWQFEAMVAKEVAEYLSVFDSSVAQARSAADTLITAIVDEAKKRISQV